MNTVSRTITGVASVLVGVWLVWISGVKDFWVLGVDDFSVFWLLGYGVFMIVIGAIIFVNEREDEIETIKKPYRKN